MKLCMGCMSELENMSICPNCGRDNAVTEEAPSNFLKPGTVLNEKYVVGVALGQGGFGITYIGYDMILGTKVAIKEYYPSDIAGRTISTGDVSAFTNNEDDYNRGREKFIEEARTLAKFSDHPCIVGVKDCFNTNNTAYMVMEFLEGVNLKEYLNRKGGKVSVDAAISILTPVMDALRAVHGVGIIHRDISPDNIFITTDGRVRLIDFGAARQSFDGHKSLSIMLKPGYAPEEQYRTRGNQGPWTDVYVLTATFYSMITGTVPPDSLERAMEDTLEIPNEFPTHIREALRNGLAVRAAERFSSIEQLQAALNGKVVEAEKGTNSKEKAEKVVPQKKINNRTIKIAIGISAILVITLVWCGIMIFGTKGDVDKGYEYLEAGNLEKADKEINKYIRIVSEKDNNEQNITMDEFIGAVALVRLEIAKGNTDLAASEIEHLFEAIGKEDTTVDYDAEVVKEIAKWYLTLYCSADKVEECVSRFTEQVPELEGYICMGDAEYEEAEPYKEYKILSIGGESTGISCYTGGVAEVTWQNEGYETTEPYKEFERKYVNDKATDEIRYTGKTKPKEFVGSWLCPSEYEDMSHFNVNLSFNSDGTCYYDTWRTRAYGTYQFVSDDTVKANFDIHCKGAGLTTYSYYYSETNYYTLSGNTLTLDYSISDGVYHSKGDVYHRN